MTIGKAGSGSVRGEDFNEVVDAIIDGLTLEVTAAEIDSQAAQDGDVLTADGAGGASWVAGGGGSQPGAVRILKFPFDFSQATALAAGVTVWTPAVNDYLLDAWIETDDPPDVWGGVSVDSPLADIGIIAAGAFVPFGFWSIVAGNPLDLHDSRATWDPSSGKVAYIANASNGITNLFAAAIIVGAGGNFQPPLFRFLTTDPLKVVVSADGTVGANPTDATSGASTLYIKVCTPGDAS